MNIMDVDLQLRKLQGAKEKASGAGMKRTSAHIDRIQRRLEAFKDVTEEYWPVKMRWALFDIDKAERAMHEENSGYQETQVKAPAEEKKRDEEKGFDWRTARTGVLGCSMVMLLSGAVTLLLGGSSYAASGFVFAGIVIAHLSRLVVPVNATSRDGDAHKEASDALSDLKKALEEHLSGS